MKKFTILIALLIAATLVLGAYNIAEIAAKGSMGAWLWVLMLSYGTYCALVLFLVLALLGRHNQLKRTGPRSRKGPNSIMDVGETVCAVVRNDKGVTHHVN